MKRIVANRYRMVTMATEAANKSGAITAMVIGPVAFLIKPSDDEKIIAAVRDSLSQA